MAFNLKGLKGKFKKEAKQKAAEVSVNVLRKRELAKNKLYPFLCDNSTSVRDAMVMCQSIQVSIQTAFNNQMLKTTVESLGLNDMVAKNPDFEKYRTLLDMLAKENVSDALDIIGGMPSAIESFIKEEMTKRPLKEIKATFL